MQSGSHECGKRQCRDIWGRECHIGIDVPSSDVKTLPVTAESIFCTSDTPISPMSPISSALMDVIGVRCCAPTTGYLVAMRGVSKEFQRREKRGLCMFFATCKSVMEEAATTK
jgi:hypothetical protein